MLRRQGRGSSKGKRSFRFQKGRELACRVVRIAEDGKLRLVLFDRFGNPVPVAFETRKIGNGDGLCPDDGSFGIVHVEGRRMRQEDVLGVEECINNVSDDFIAAVSCQDPGGIDGKVISDGFAQRVCHRRRINLWLEARKGLLGVLHDGGKGEDIEVAFVGVDDGLFMDRSDSVRSEVFQCFSKPVIVHCIVPPRQRRERRVLRRAPAS